MSVHYKFKSMLDYDTLTFDGLHISLKELKKLIIQQKNLGKNTDFDLLVKNAQTNEVYGDEEALIPKNTSLIIARVPLSAQAKRANSRQASHLFPANKEQAFQESSGFVYSSQVDLARMEGSEDDKISAMMSQSTQDYDPSNYMKVRSNQVGPVPPNYICYRCQKNGHWIRDCPLRDSTMSKKPAYFLDEWLSTFFWVEKVNGNRQKARCKLCSKDFGLCTMGVNALYSHENSEKHKARVQASQMHTIKPHVAQQHVAQERLPTNEFCQALSSDAAVHLSSSRAVDSQFVPRGTTVDSPVAMDLRQENLEDLLLDEQVTRAELLWVVHCVLNNESLCSAIEAVSLFPVMFTDSEIASHMHLNETKICSFINHGLSPYFSSELRKSLIICDCLVFCLEESLNKIAQRQKIDIHVRFWDPCENMVRCRYLTSIFVGFGRATDLLISFQDAIGDTLLKRTLQVSIDGPNMNDEIFKMFSEAQESKLDPCSILDIGSCGLLKVHDAVETCAAATQWSLIEFFEEAYNLFKNVPSQRAHFTRYTGSKLLPLKCCSTKWVENIPVAQRCLTLVPNLKKYVEIVERTKTVPESDSYTAVKSALEDTLLPCKLAFFLFICEHTQSFLKEFRTDRPCAVFLYKSVSDFLRTFLQIFIKEEILNSFSSFTDIDLSERSDHLLSASQIKLDVSVLKSIRAVGAKVKEGDLLLFRQNCRTALVSFTEKLMEISVLKNKLAMAISCFDPALIVSKPALAQQFLSLTVVKLVSMKWLKDVVGDRARRQFGDLIKRPDVVLSLKQFRRATDRIDVFYMKLLHRRNKNIELKSVIRLVCTLSHGKASAERGFSINEEFVFENEQEQSLISQQMIHDAVTAGGGIVKLEFTKPVIHAVRNSHAMYEDFIYKKNLEKLENENQEKEKRSSEENEELQKKRIKVTSDVLNN